MTNIRAMMSKEWRHIWRDPSTLAIATVGAAALLILMAYTFSADIERVPVAALDLDRTAQSRAYLQRFANEPFFQPAFNPANRAEAEALVKNGQAKGAIIVPAGFARAGQRGEEIAVQIIVDGVEPDTAYQIIGNAEALSTGYALDLLETRLNRDGQGGEIALPLEFRVWALFNPDLKEINSVLPGLMAILLAMPALSASMSLAKEKEQGSIESLIVTPIRRYQLLVGKVIPHLTIGLADIFIFTLIGYVIFKVPFRGSLLNLFVFSAAFLLANMGVGLFIASLVRSQMAALVVTGVLFVMPPINESGIFFPLYAMSGDARLQAMLWPATHYVIIARGIFLKGIAGEVLWPHGLYLLGLGLLLNGVAIWRLKKRLD